jgi:hypothetical protein
LHSNSFLKHVIDGKIEVTEWRRRRCKQLLNDFTEKRGYWKLKNKTLDCNLWRIFCGRGYGPVVRQTTTEWMYVFWTTNITYVTWRSSSAEFQLPFCDVKPDVHFLYIPDHLRLSALSAANII